MQRAGLSLTYRAHNRPNEAILRGKAVRASRVAGLRLGESSLLVLEGLDVEAEDFVGDVGFERRSCTG